ncbi:MAG: CHAT domain-containing protein [Saprospiraceae bacterium]|nr:CHAT domain-containing protein [Saprospiraceae bacterium]
MSATEVQKELLQPGQALLEYFVGDSSIFIFVLRPDTLVMQEVKKDFPLEDWVSSLRDNIYLNRTTGATAYAEAAYNLYQKLIAPVKSLLPKQLIIIPDGILGYVPFEALLTAKPERAIRFNTHAYLLKEHQISYCYSATLLREMQQKKKVQEPTGTLLAVAPFYSGDTTLLANLFAYDETTRKDLAPLQNSGEEVYRISKLWKGEVLTGADATETKFTELAGNYRILHLATHGRADERVGDYSFLAFSEIKDSVENELLYVRDLYNLQLNADLVVLSACETGLGKLSRGEGIISLARAFAYAGAKSIVTTLWSVDDAKTKDVMVDFYRNLKKGMTKDAALRQAKLNYLKGHTNPGDAHPYYWAGFAPIGDMRALH